MKSTEERIKFLENCANLYETNGTSPISDAEYDVEYEECRKIDPSNSFFSSVGGIDEEHIYGTKIKHEVICGSLLKDPSPEEFFKSFTSIYAGIDLSQYCFGLQHKVDGSAICCVYDNGNLTNVTTRGRDGWYGMDVTPNGKHIKDIPKTIPYKGKVEIRGECYKDRADFYKNWAGEYANPRNFTAGSINQKDPLETKKRGLSFVGYEVVRKDFDTEKEKLQFIIDNGFENLESSTRFTKTGLSIKQLTKAIQIYMKDIGRSTLPYDIDGIVVKLNKIPIAKSLGTVAGGKKPKSSRAVKFPPEQKITELIGIEENVGRTGAIALVGLLKPVNLGGAIIQRVSLHNYKFIKDKGLTIGCTVLLQKSGDIIPYIVRKIKDGKTTIEPPTECPACGGELEWDKNNVTVHCLNDACVAKINRSLEHWFKKIGTLGIGKGIIKKLTDEEILEWDNKPIINCISDMYWKLDNDRETEHPFRKYAHLKENFGEKTYENILKSVKNISEMTLAKFIEALGISQIGSMASELTVVAPTLEDINDLTVDDIVKIDGFALKKASGFVKGWKVSQPEINKLLEFITIIEPKTSSNKLDGQKYCFTGSFSDPSRKEMEKMTEDNGGKKSSVSKNLTALVWDESISGNKVDKAKELGIPIITQKEFLEKLK